ncbi:MAG TPA: class I SAM-dependent methyltransferase, partial [Blastocatellia bacterium]|nr:class I SAM-dependent methyltransferase [Blastocatellia bacterium]
MKLDLREHVSSKEKKQAYVNRLFETIAPRYDLITVVLSYGMDRGWKRRLVDMLALRGDEGALDLACGTGDIAFELAAGGASTIGLDVTPRMLDLAAAKQRHHRARFVAGDMMHLPFADERFDLVTSGYGIRNVPDI